MLEPVLTSNLTSILTSPNPNGIHPIFAAKCYMYIQNTTNQHQQDLSDSWLSLASCWRHSLYIHTLYIHIYV